MDSYDYYKPLIETASRDQLENHQLLQLSKLIKTVFENNPFYREKWSKVGLSDWREIRTMEDFQRLPFIVREDLSRTQVDFPPYGNNITWPLEKYTHLHLTSGTKSTPLKVLGTLDDWASQARTWCYNFSGVGIEPGDSIFIAFSFGPFLGFWSIVTGAEMANIMMIPGGGMSTLQRIQFIMDHKPTVVACIPSYALRIAETAQENNINLADSSVRVLVHGGEPGASIPSIRSRIENTWQAKSYDTTGLSEVGHFGFECLTQSGVHVIESEFLFEIFEPGTSKPVADGEIGELVLTSLYRTGMPAIRYRTGDLVKLNRVPCDCGRTFTRLQGGIIGRTDNKITVRGINIYPSAIEDCLMSYPEIAEYQVEFLDVMGMKEIKLQVEINGQGKTQAEQEILLKKIQQDMRQRFFLRAEIDVKPPGSIPRSPGKAKRFVYH